MSDTIKRIWDAVTSFLVLVMVVLAVLLWGFRLFGFNAFVVLSGSMEPDYPVGSVVYVQNTSPSSLEVGDVITFCLTNSTQGTHRIIDIVSENGTLSFRTQGDANQEADSQLVLESDVIGEVVFCIPYLGFLATYIQHPPGMYIGISAVAVLLLLVILPTLIFENKKENYFPKEKC